MARGKRGRVVTFFEAREVLQTRLRGRRSEMRTYEALRVATNERPHWFLGYERPTEKEDFREGIDLIVLSDVGKLFLQIKSSRHGCARFLDRQRNHRWRRPVRVVVINASDTPGDIREKVFNEAAGLRARFLETRRTTT